MNTEPFRNGLAEVFPMRPTADMESPSRPVTGWAELVSWVTLGLVTIGISSIASAAWPGNQRARWLFIFVSVTVWILGAVRSGMLARLRDFPEGKYKGTKVVLSGGLGLGLGMSGMFFALSGYMPKVYVLSIIIFSGIASVAVRSLHTPNNSK